MSNATTAFVDVAVVPMTEPALLEQQTVVVEDGRISEVGPASQVTVPLGAQVVDGTGRYLMPGLCDMHVHLFNPDSNPGQLVMYLAEGTTTVRSLSGVPRNAHWRDGVTAGEIVGPTIFTAGPTLIDGIEGSPEFLATLPITQPQTDEEAVATVRAQAAGWPDLVKVYDGMQPEVYLAAINAGAGAGIYVTGHLLDELPLERIVEAGLREIAHVDELNFHHWRGVPGAADFVLDYEAIPATAELLAANDIAVVSNISLDEIMADLIFDTDDVLARPGYRVVRPEVIESWRTEGRQLGKFAGQGPFRRDVELPFLKALVRGLDEAGVIVLTGTDTSVRTEGSLPEHIHREVELLIEARLSEFDALAAATTNAARVVARMGGDGGFGTVAVGQRADLILLERNPLENVSNTRARVGVMARGRYRTQSELNRRVDEYVATYQEELTT